MSQFSWRGPGLLEFPCGQYHISISGSTFTEKDKKFLSPFKLKQVSGDFNFILLERTLVLSLFLQERKLCQISLFYLMTLKSRWTSWAVLDPLSGHTTCDLWNQYCLAKQMSCIQKTKHSSPHYESTRQNLYYNNRQMGWLFYSV